DPSSCRMPRDAGADQKDQRTDRSCAACDRMARTRRGKIRKKDTPASRADRPSSPNLPATTDRENHSEALVASTFSTKSALSGKFDMSTHPSLSGQSGPRKPHSTTSIYGSTGVRSVCAVVKSSCGEIFGRRPGG